MAQYCIDQSNYTQWLCNNVKGAQQACSAPRFVGNFPNLSACETARKNTLPNDFRWQSMTKCVECGPSIPSFKQPHPAQENLNQKNLEEERLTEKIRQEAERTEEARKEYLKDLHQKKDNEYPKMMIELYDKMKTSPPPKRSKEVFTKDSCSGNISIGDLKKRLAELERTRDDAEKGIIESDKIIIKSQEIILLARAKGDLKEGRDAEEKARQAEESKNEYRKNKEKAEEEITILEQYINIADRNNFECLSDVCNIFREQVNRDKEALKKFVKEAEEISKRQNERIEEIYGEIKDFAIDILPVVGELSIGINKIYGKVEKLKLLRERNPQKYKEILITLENLSNYYKEAQRNAEILDNISKGTKATKLSYKIPSQYLSYMEKIKENSEAAQKELEKLKQSINEAEEFVIDIAIDKGIENLDKLGAAFSKKLAYRLAKIAPAINVLRSVLDVSYHIVKINFLDEEVNRDYKFTEDLFKQYNGLKSQLDKDMQKLRKCENYSKKALK